MLGEGDVLVVTRLDRLARSSHHLLTIVKTITDVGGSLRSLRETWADTTNAHGRLMLTILGGIAEFERELIVQRTSEGRTRALAFGRPAKLTHHQRLEALARRDAGEPIVQIARSYNVHHSMISRLR
jgi:DNA invertase Pin-like site-specific DNA recombinase